VKALATVLGLDDSWALVLINHTTERNVSFIAGAPQVFFSTYYLLGMGVGFGLGLGDGIGDGFGAANK
jgi:hypothetical protein